MKMIRTLMIAAMALTFCGCSKSIVIPDPTLPMRGHLRHLNGKTEWVEVEKMRSTSYGMLEIQVKLLDRNEIERRLMVIDGSNLELSKK